MGSGHCSGFEQWTGTVRDCPAEPWLSVTVLLNRDCPAEPWLSCWTVTVLLNRDCPAEPWLSVTVRKYSDSPSVIIYGKILLKMRPSLIIISKFIIKILRKAFFQIYSLMIWPYMVNYLLYNKEKISFSPSVTARNVQLCPAIIHLHNCAKFQDMWKWAKLSLQDLTRKYILIFNYKRGMFHRPPARPSQLVSN